MQMTTKALAYGLVFGFLAAVAPACGTVKPPAKCNSTTCADGCCGTDGECYTGVSPQACGTGAATCQECTGGESCIQGQCRIGTDGGGGGAGGSGGSGGGTGNCNSSNCANGCCKSDGTCQTVTSAQSCGKMGGACTACSFGQTCAAGTCTSNACGSCRDAVGNCTDGGATNNNACGVTGGICLRCDAASGQTCVNGVCSGGACSATTCADGCCASGTCVRDGGNAQCGGNGVACTTCQGTGQCVNNVCSGGGSDGGSDGGLFPVCDAASCPTGCCLDFGAGTSLCTAGDDPILGCGTGGAVCVSCIAQLKFTCNPTSRTCQ